MGKTKDLTVRSYTLVNMLKQLATDTANGVTPDPANYSGRGGGDWGGRGRGRGRGGSGRGGRGGGDRGGRCASSLYWNAAAVSRQHFVYRLTTRLVLSLLRKFGGEGGGVPVLVSSWNLKFATLLWGRKSVHFWV